MSYWWNWTNWIEQHGLDHKWLEGGTISNLWFQLANEGVHNLFSFEQKMVTLQAVELRRRQNMICKISPSKAITFAFKHVCIFQCHFFVVDNIRNRSEIGLMPYQLSSGAEFCAGNVGKIRWFSLFHKIQRLVIMIRSYVIKGSKAMHNFFRGADVLKYIPLYNDKYIEKDPEMWLS